MTMTAHRYNCSRDIAALVFATQQTYGLTTAHALAQLGMNSTAWLWQRSAVSVLLVCLSGYLRYRAPRKQLLSLEERKRSIEEQMELDALRAKKRAQQAQGAIGLVRGMAQAARGAPPMTESSGMATAVPLPAHDPGQIEPDNDKPDDDEQEVRAEAATPLSELMPARCALRIAWPTVRLAEAETQAPRNGRRRQRQSS